MDFDEIDFISGYRSRNHTYNGRSAQGNLAQIQILILSWVWLFPLPFPCLCLLLSLFSPLCVWDGSCVSFYGTHQWRKYSGLQRAEVRLKRLPAETPLHHRSFHLIAHDLTNKKAAQINLYNGHPNPLNNSSFLL